MKRLLIADLRFTSHSAPRAESGAKATAVQTLSRMLDTLEPREASGLRRVHRRFVPGSTTA
jgi:hypothetical protein